MELISILILSWISTICATNGIPTLSTPNNQKISANIDGTVTLPCTASSKPPPTIEWYREKKLINTEWKRYRHHHRGLKIRGVTRDDEGAYVCRAVNGFGSVEIEVYLEINDEMGTSTHHGPIVVSGESPQIRAFPVDKIIQRQVGGSLKLRCDAHGDPDPTVTWFRNGQSLPVNSKGRVRVYRTVLQVKNASVEDTGNYSCVAHSAVGRDVVTFTVEIVELYHRKPEFLEKLPVSTTVQIGGALVLDCKIKSESKPTVKWLKRVHDWERSHVNDTLSIHNGKNFKLLQSTFSHQKHVYTTRFAIFDVSPLDAGQYMCIAANDNGFNYQSALVDVAAGGVHSPIEYASIPTTLTVIIVVVSVAIIVIVLLVCVGNRRQNRTSARPPPLPKRPPHLALRVELDNPNNARKWNQYGVVVRNEDHTYIQGRRMGSC